MKSAQSKNTDKQINKGVLSDQEYRRMSGRDRRNQPRVRDRLFQVYIGLNVLSWILLIAAVVMFHLARPELVTGVQSFWGVEGRQNWSNEHAELLNYLLQGCLGLTLVSMILNRRRSRRETDHFGINLIILAVIVFSSLLTLQITVNV